MKHLKIMEKSLKCKFTNIKTLCFKPNYISMFEIHIVFFQSHGDRICWKSTYIRKNLVHSNHMVMTIMWLVSKSTTFTTIIRLVLLVILVVDVCNHICDYCNHICNYNVDIIKWSHKCDYNLWLLNVWMEK
jgi:hypothetical protein